MLRGSKALVTGASRGIGFAIAKHLAQAGAQVVITGREEETLKQAAAEIGEKAQYLVWDLADLSVMEERLNQTIEMMGGLDILVNNAGTTTGKNEWGGKLISFTVEEWDRIFNLNLRALFFLTQAVGKYMIDHEIRGNVLNISSSADKRPAAGPYGASKIAVTALTRGLGREYAPYGIVVNGIAPGPAATIMSNWTEGKSLESAAIPFGRLAVPEELAKLAMVLLDENSEMICGETVALDGARSVL